MRLGNPWKHLREIRAPREAVALGLAVGILLGFTPLFGLKTLLALGLAYALKASKAAAIVGVTLHDLATPFIPLLLRVEYDTGYGLLSRPHRRARCGVILPGPRAGPAHDGKRLTPKRIRPWRAPRRRCDGGDGALASRHSLTQPALAPSTKVRTNALTRSTMSGAVPWVAICLTIALPTTTASPEPATSRA